jgi:repressor LexA
MENIRTLRKKHGLTQAALAEMLHVHQTAVSQWEKGRTVPDIEQIKELSTIFNVPMECIADMQAVHAYGNTSTAAPKHGVRIPVLGSVAAGIPLEAVTDVEDYEEIPEALAAGGEYVALRIHGDSMEPRMLEGDVVIVRVQETIESGETAIVMVDGGEATCKRIKKTPDGLMLISNNPAYEPMFYTRKQVAELPVRIFGKVVELRAKFR